MVQATRTIPVIQGRRTPKDKTPPVELVNALKNYHPVHLEDNEFNQKLTWCLEHCQNKFRDLSDSNGRTWYFENEQDAMMFAIKWS